MSGHADASAAADPSSAGPESEVLLRLTARANDALTTDAIYEPALEAVRQLLKVERASILLFDDDGLMRFKAWTGLSDGYRARVEGHSPWKRGARDPRAFCTPDVLIDPELAAFAEVFRAERIRGLVFIPLVCRGELLGKFMAYSPVARAFTEHELKLGSAIAVQVAQAVFRARLMDAERSARALAELRADRTRRLLRVTSHLSNALFASDVAALVIDEGTRALEARNGGIWLLEDGALRLLRHCGYREQVLARVAQIPLDADVPVARAVLRDEAHWLEGQGEYERAFPSFSRFTNELPGTPPEVAVAALPLRIHGQVIGGLAITFEGRRRFDEGERAFLELLAQHCAQGLERARLYQDARAAELRARFLAQGSGILSASLDFEATLRHLCELAVPQVAGYCAVMLAEGDGRLRCAASRSASSDDPSAHDARRWDAVERVVRMQGALLAPAGEGTPSSIVVPMRAHGRVYGAILLEALPGVRFVDADLETAVQLGERAGISLHNASLYRQAIAAVKLRDDFLSVAGHELRTPVTALLLAAQSLVRSDGAVDPERLGQRAGRLIRYAQRLSKLVDELLDVTRVTSGRLQLSPREVDLCEIVRDAVESVREQIERTGVEVRVSACDPVVGTWDRERLEQVTLNLLSNALKYGGDQPIDVAVRRVDGQAVLSLKDRGIGISAEHQVRIFERFERAVSSRNFSGLGLGLWIARQIIEAHGGTIGVLSEDGAGAEFTVRLPVDGVAGPS